MRRLVWLGDKRLELQEVRRPVPRSGEAVIRVSRAGVCHSDLHVLNDENPTARPPIVLGHEVVGVVTALGRGESNIELEARVVVNPCLECGVCLQCRTGSPNRCPVGRQVGMSVDWPGGWAEELRVPIDRLIKVPADVGDAEAAMVEPLGVALHGLSLSSIEPGQPVVVFGAGVIGLLTAQALKSLGAVVAIVDVVPERLQRANLIGVDYALNASAIDLVEWAAQTFDEAGVPLAIETAATAGSLASALRTVRRGGQVTLIGAPVDAKPLDLLPMLVGELHLVGVNGYRRDQLVQALDLMASGQISVKDMITDVVNLDSLAATIRASQLRPDLHLKVQVAP